MTTILICITAFAAVVAAYAVLAMRQDAAACVHYRKAHGNIWREMQELRGKYHRVCVDYANLRERGPYR